MQIDSFPQNHVSSIFLSNPIWHAVMESISDAVLLLDRHGYLQFINPSAKEIYGLNPETDIGKRWDEVLQTAYWSSEKLDDLKQMMFSGQTAKLTRTHTRADGSMAYIEVKITPLHKQEGGSSVLNGILVVIKDLTERTHVAQRLENVREHWDTVNEYLPLMIGRLDRMLQFEYLNPALARHLGQPVTAIEGTPIHQWIDREVFKELQPTLLQVLTGEEIELEIMIPDGTGSVRALQGRCIPVGSEGSLILMLLDITDLKKAHKQLAEANQQLEDKVSRRTSELESSNRDLERFVFLASHDLQEPLRMIISYLQLLRRKSREKFDQEDLELFGFAENGAKRMKTLLDDLLFYSRFKRTETSMLPVSMEELWAEIKDFLRESIQESEAVISSVALPSVKGDEMQLIHLLQNLLSNAIKFVKEKAPEIHLTWEKKGNMAQFALSDNGIGISPEFKDRIFEVFERLHTRDEFPGTGIGLSICKEVIDNAGGDMWIESSLGEGTTFYFTLPLIES